MKTKILLHAWSVQKKDNKYYLPYTHWIYLKEIVKYYDEVVLLSPTKLLSENEKTSSVSIECFSNVEVYELPNSSSYLNSVKYFPHYIKAYSTIKDVTVYYSRYPSPFGWLQKIFGRRSKRILHYVGDPIDVIKNDPTFSSLKKKILIAGFKPENILYNWACRNTSVYTNGHHIAEKLSLKNIKAIPLVSSTLTQGDFHFDKERKYNPYFAKFIYLGNLRTAKGVETVLRAFSIYQNLYPNSTLSLIGSGEFENSLRTIVLKENILNVSFMGRIDDREKINNLLRESDVFLFGSLSEGSPRVILEAIANGLVVISTPVGSLPSIFENNKDLLFSDFNNPMSFVENINKLIEGKFLYDKLRLNSYNKIKDFTIENFIKTIFHEK